MLYLLKSGRIREYLQQNLAILAAEEGDIVEVGYRLRWVQPGCVPAPGDPCVVVFGDAPYEDFVPVRFGTLRSVEQAPDRFDLEVVLGPWVRPGGRRDLTDRWTGDGRARRGGAFLLTDENPGLFGPRSRTEEDESWRAIVDALGSNGFYERSIFCRLLGADTFDGHPIEAAGEPVPVGSDIRLRLEMRTPTATTPAVPVLVDAVPAGSVELREWRELPANGLIELPLTVHTVGDVEVALRFLPEPLLSSRPALRFCAGAAVPGPTSPAPEADVLAPLRSQEVVRLAGRLERDAQMGDEAWVSLFEDVLLPWAPDDATLIQGYAKRLYALGHHQSAVDVLRRVDHRTPAGDLLLLVASVQARLPIRIEEFIERIDLNAGSSFDLFLAALDCASEDVWNDLIGALPHQVLGDAKSLRFLQSAQAHVTAADGVGRLAELLAYSDGAAAVQLLHDRWPDPKAAPERVVYALLDFSESAGDVVPYLTALIDRMTSAGEWQAVSDLLGRAGKRLTVDELRNVMRLAASALLGADSPTLRDTGFGYLIDVAESALRAGDLDLAMDAAIRGLGYARLRGDEAVLSAALEVVGSVEQVVADTEVFRHYRAAQENQHAAGLRKRYGGRAIHLIGGQESEWAKDLRELTGADIRWHATEKSRFPNLDWSRQLMADDVVVVLVDHIGHDVVVKLKPICERSGAQWVNASWGKRAVLDALCAASEGAHHG